MTQPSISSPKQRFSVWPSLPLGPFVEYITYQATRRLLTMTNTHCKQCRIQDCCSQNVYCDDCLWNADALDSKVCTDDNPCADCHTATKQIVFCDRCGDDIEVTPVDWHTEQDGLEPTFCDRCTTPVEPCEGCSRPVDNDLDFGFCTDCLDVVDGPCRTPLTCAQGIPCPKCRPEPTPSSYAHVPPCPVCRTKNWRSRWVDGGYMACSQQCEDRMSVMGPY